MPETKERLSKSAIKLLCAALAVKDGSIFGQEYVESICVEMAELWNDRNVAGGALLDLFHAWLEFNDGTWPPSKEGFEKLEAAFLKAADEVMERPAFSSQAEKNTE